MSTASDHVRHPGELRQQTCLGHHLRREELRGNTEGVRSNDKLDSRRDPREGVQRGPGGGAGERVV